jgi:DNA-binding SARP family transcriptional activator
MDVRVLGNVEIGTGVEAITLTRAGERCVLATLALSAGRRVHVDTLVEHVWADDPPANAEQTVASYVGAVRRAIELGGGDRRWLSNHRPGAYQLDVAADLVDYHRFAALIAVARGKVRAGEPAGAAMAYQQAIELRRGVALADVSGQWAEHRRYAIEQEYLDALCELYQQWLALGQFATVASNAAQLLPEIIPTDRMIVLASYGLAGSGQHAAINDFVNRASQRMWEAAEARPSAEALAIARDLVAHPGARLALPRFGPPQGGRAEPDGEPGTRPSVVLIANHNGRVYQAAGDQHIITTS